MISVIFALSVQGGSWWISHTVFPGALEVILLGFAPWDGKHRTELTTGVLAIWAWALLLPWIPWSQSKRMALDVWSIQGQPLEVVQRVIDSYLMDVRLVATAGDRVGAEVRGEELFGEPHDARDELAVLVGHARVR